MCKVLCQVVLPVNSLVHIQHKFPKAITLKSNLVAKYINVI